MKRKGKRPRGTDKEEWGTREGAYGLRGEEQPLPVRVPFPDKHLNEQPLCRNKGARSKDSETQRRLSHTQRLLNRNTCPCRHSSPNTKLSLPGWAHPVVTTRRTSLLSLSSLSFLVVGKKPKSHVKIWIWLPLPANEIPPEYIPIHKHVIEGCFFVFPAKMSCDRKCRA